MNVRVLFTFVVLGALAPACSDSTGPGCSPLADIGAHAICLVDGTGSSATVGPYQLTASASENPCACPGFGSPPPGVGLGLELEKTPVDTSDTNFWSCTDVLLYSAASEGTLVYSANASLGKACESSGVGFSGPVSMATHEGLGWATVLRDDDVGAHVAPGVYYARIRITWTDGTTTEMLAGVVRRV